MMKENIIKIFQDSFRENWGLPAVTDYTDSKTLSYADLARNIARLHVLFNQCQLKRGQKIALIGKNTTSWVTVFMATITYGATIVPILHEFNPHDVQHIINHSEAVLLFCSDSIWDQLEMDKLKAIRAVISINDMHVLAERDGETIGQFIRGLSSRFRHTFKKGFTRDSIHYPDIDNSHVMVLNYTSGTTGFSKGVMITGNNVAGNVVFGIRSQLHRKGTRCLSFLPLAHAYGCAFDMLTPLAVGAHITLLGRIPSPKILIKAMSEVRPHLIICVPLVLEKIYRKQIVPMITRNVMRWALAIPYLDTKIYGQIRKRLVDAFGGNFEEVIVGGAPLNSEVEDFLYKIKFPFTVGYGMTECAPLVSYTHWSEYIPHTAGRLLPGIMEAKILSDDPVNKPGEICLRGENVMRGYFKNTEATDRVLYEDGWLHTGDIGTLSPDGTIAIRGRSKTMILTSNGQNIYPEDIEAKLNNMPFVMESLIVERDDKLVALVYPDYDAMDATGLTRDQLPETMEQIRKELNSLVAPYEKVSAIQIVVNEFDKTPKRSIKRFLYS
ncbi:MAG: AMP-binding protein [Muribaculaceae bacterium]|jgi:long-chain acyl-CoA synthetase|nr:AMP-binding protein [Muribaculaceae bacterium]